MAAQEEFIESAGGVKIFVRSWKPAGAPRGVIVINHGVNSHGGQYLWTGEQFAARGFSVYALDMRGRGRSEGKRFFVKDIADYVSDLSATINLAKSREPGLKVFLLGHSAGGVVSCTYCLDHQSELAGLICESFAYRVPAPGFALQAIKGLAAIAPHAPALKLPMKDFTRDPAALKALLDDPLTKDEAQPAATVAALVRADERLKKSFGQISLPVFIMHGTADKATVPAGSKEFYEHAGAKDKTLKLYDGHVHDLLSDTGKQGVFNDIASWVEARL